MTESYPSKSSLIFADSNVFIEALFIDQSPASIVMRLVNLGLFSLATCQIVVNDVENAILNKLRENSSNIDEIIKRWSIITEETNLIIHNDPSDTAIRETYQKYIHLMRHKNDIPILAAAIDCKPHYILSGNREHFNDNVGSKCGIHICNCAEFIEMIDS